MTVSRLDLDIVEQDNYEVSASATAHAVETGVPITDHVIPAQDRITATVCVSGRQSSTLFVEGASAGSMDLSDGVKATGIVVPEGTDRIGDVHATLRRLCRDAIDVDIDGLRRPIEGWIIERVSSPRTIETSGLLVVDLALVEIRYAEIEEVDAPSPRVERGRRQRDRGRQTLTAVTPTSEPDPDRSILQSGADWLAEQGVI